MSRWGSLEVKQLDFWLGNVLRATTASTIFDIWTSKSGPNPSALTLLTWKCASRHNGDYNGVRSFDISTSKSDLRPWVFDTFDLEMCFAPSRRALFRHRNFQKRSENGVLCTFWLGNVLRATTAALFRHRNFQKWSENGVLCTFWLGNVLRTLQFFISHLARWLRTRRFSEVTFQPSGATNHWKNTVNGDFPTFSRTCIFLLLALSLIFSLLNFSSLALPTSAFHLSILSEVWLLNFLRQIHMYVCTYAI